MTRGSFFKSIAAMLCAKAGAASSQRAKSPRYAWIDGDGYREQRVEYFGTFNWGLREFSAPENADTYGGLVLVDGRRIEACTFADTEAGIVHTLAVIPGSPKAFAKGYSPSDFPGREVECQQDSVLKETLHGHVRVFGHRALNWTTE